MNNTNNFNFSINHGFPETRTNQRTEPVSGGNDLLPCASSTNPKNTFQANKNIDNPYNINTNNFSGQSCHKVFSQSIYRDSSQSAYRDSNQSVHRGYTQSYYNDSNEYNSYQEYYDMLPYQSYNSHYYPSEAVPQNTLSTFDYNDDVTMPPSFYPAELNDTNYDCFYNEVKNENYVQNNIFSPNSNRLYDQSLNYYLHKPSFAPKTDDTSPLYQPTVQEQTAINLDENLTNNKELPQFLEEKLPSDNKLPQFTEDNLTTDNEHTQFVEKKSANINKLSPLLLPNANNLLHFTENKLPSINELSPFTEEMPINGNKLLQVAEDKPINNKELSHIVEEKLSMSGLSPATFQSYIINDIETNKLDIALENDENNSIVSLSSIQIENLAVVSEKDEIDANASLMKCFRDREKIDDQTTVQKDSINSFLCHQCVYITDSQDDLDLHISSTHSTNQDLTSKVDESLLIAKHLDLTNKNVNNDDANKEKIITKKTRQRTKKLHTCPVCLFTTTNKYDYNRHLRDHMGRKLFECSECSFTTKMKYDFQRHLKIHTGERDFNCHLCDYKASRKNVLERHMKVHAGSEAHKCPKCSYSTTTKGTLQRHMTKHSITEEDKCPHCDYTTSHSGNLLKHIQIHSGQKALVCQFCTYTTSHKDVLQKHLLKHSQPKENVCPRCPYSCRWKSGISRHLLLRHKIKS